MTRYSPLIPEEVAGIINNNDMVAFSGFTAAGSPKVVPIALALRATALHEKGEDFALQLIAGASAGYQVDDELVAAMCDKWCALY